MTLLKQTRTLFAIFAAFLLIGCQNSETDLHAQTTEAGDSEPEIVLVEYSDFQCPTCAYFYPIVEKLKEHYGDKLVVKYRYFPLNSHRYSMLAARAAEAAKNQGKFAEMQKLLFTNQDVWASSSNPQKIFIGYAKQIGLNMQQFKEDLNSAETQQTVMEQKKEGLAHGVRGTPSFIINGEMMVSLPRNYKEFKALLDIYLAEEKEQAAN